MIAFIMDSGEAAIPGSGLMVLASGEWLHGVA
jgi:hypothetical protein